MTQENILWVYIGLLVLGGVMGMVKAKSKVSLVASLAFAGALALINARIFNVPGLVHILLLVLIIVFGIRLAKTKKFMPSGLMIVLTAVTLILLQINFN